MGPEEKDLSEKGTFWVKRGWDLQKLHQKNRFQMEAQKQPWARLEPRKTGGEGNEIGQQGGITISHREGEIFILISVGKRSRDLSRERMLSDFQVKCQQFLNRALTITTALSSDRCRCRSPDTCWESAHYLSNSGGSHSISLLKSENVCITRDLCWSTSQNMPGRNALFFHLWVRDQQDLPLCLYPRK